MTQFIFYMNSQQLRRLAHETLVSRRDQTYREKAQPMRNNTLKNTIDSGARTVRNIATSTEAVTEILQDGKDTVGKFLKETRHLAEDWMDEATHKIKRFPIGSVVVAFSVGALFGVLISRTGRD